MQLASDLNVLFITAIELMGKHPEHAATIHGQYKNCATGGSGSSRSSV